MSSISHGIFHFFPRPLVICKPSFQTLEALQEQARVEYNEPNLVAKLVCGADLLESFSVPG